MLAKTAHPDAGDSAEHDRQIAAARDALLRQLEERSQRERVRARTMRAGARPKRPKSPIFFCPHSARMSTVPAQGRIATPVTRFVTSFRASERPKLP